MVNLRAAVKNGEVTDPQVICETALEIDGDLETWRAGVPLNWRYATIDGPEAAVGTCFDGKSHVYPNLWIAEACLEQLAHTTDTGQPNHRAK
jgi:hypothetical protein